MHVPWGFSRAMMQFSLEQEEELSVPLASLKTQELKFVGRRPCKVVQDVFHPQYDTLT